LRKFSVRGNHSVVLKVLLAIIAAASVVALRAAIASPHDTTYMPTWSNASQYKLIFADEFSGNTLNTKYWTPGWFGVGDTAPVQSDDLAADSSENVSVSDGSLNLELKKQPIRVDGKTYPFTGALVSSNGKFSFAYGAIEFRAYVPVSVAGTVANWPALWTDGRNWPVDGEDDIFEGIDGWASYHFHSGAPGSSGSPNNGSAVSTKFFGWHTFGADWQPGIVRYYYDGKLVGTITKGVTGAPQYIVMANSLGPGSPLAAGDTDFRVAWVRVWKHM
jgi:beta-glucanase (GH16 family)